MSIFSSYALKNLKKNKIRTIVTIIGIILSVAMFVAVTESFWSADRYMIELSEHTEGKFHAYKINVDNEELNELKNNDEITEYTASHIVGFALTEESERGNVYLCLTELEDNYPLLCRIDVTEGRLPEKADEIALPASYLKSLDEEYKVGDKIILTTGQRVYDGETLDNNSLIDDEEFADREEKTFTITGIVSNDRAYGGGIYNCAFTKTGGKYTASNFFFKVDNLKKLTDPVNPSISDANLNRDLLMFMGYGNSSFMGLTIGLGIILITIISVGSIALIYNSFSISVNEKTKEFGLMRSLGATKRQIRRMVISEGLMLSAVGIPIGLAAGLAGIGITLRALAGDFATLVSDNMAARDVTIKLVPNVYALLAAVFFSLLTILISAYIPAKKAMRQNIIDSVRQSNAIKDRSKRKAKKSRFRSVFGFEAAIAKKYFARSRKKYSITIVSLALSLILFISASSLVYYFTQAFAFKVTENPYQITGQITRNVSEREAKRVISELSSVEGVTETMIISSEGLEFAPALIPEKKALSSDAEKYLISTYKENGKEYSRSIAPSLLFVDDKAFKKICDKSGLNADDYFNEKEPMALLYDNLTVSYDVPEEGTFKSTRINVYGFDKFPAKMNMKVFDKEGYQLIGYDYDEGIYDLINNQSGEEEFKKASENDTEKQLTAGARITEDVFFSRSMGHSVLMIYPEKMKNIIAGEDTKMFRDLYFKTETTKDTFEKMEKITENADGIWVENEEDGNENILALMKLVKVFSYGFITLISLIAAANVFNTIYTNITLRRRDIAMLKSIGLSGRGVLKMMNFESLIYGLLSLVSGLPIAAGITFIIYYYIYVNDIVIPFTLPWGNIIFAVLSVFAVVFASMLYATARLKKNNLVDDLKNENV